jgi:hypothetical protein
MALTREIHALYDALPADATAPPIHPFIGRQYREATPGVLRVLVMGINCYYGQSPPGPGVHWFPTWVRERRFTFFARTFSESSVIAEELERSPDFDGFRYAGMESLYVTNMVRRYLPPAGGKKAAQVSEALLDEGSRVWRDELDILREHNALPHVVIVFGGQIWGRAWMAFGGRVQPNGWIVSYTPCAKSSELLHHLNRVVVPEGDSQRPLLLVRVDHPAAVGDKKRAAWIVSHPEFRKVTRLRPS